MAHDGTGTGWNTSFPTNAEFVQDAAKEIRDLRLAMGIRVGKEHEALAAASGGGEHKVGSGKIYSQLLAPTLRPDGTTPLDATDEGRMWFDETLRKLKRWSGTAWIALQSYA